MDIEWTEMVYYQQQIQKLSRLLLPTKKQFLTPSECELLAWIYFNQDRSTPFILSQCSGMKKEAVSRCLKKLYEKNCITKEKQSCDERSYKLFVTDKGLLELKKCYQNILQPFYDIWRSAGSDFEEFLKYADKVVTKVEHI